MQFRCESPETSAVVRDFFVSFGVGALEQAVTKKTADTRLRGHPPSLCRIRPCYCKVPSFNFFKASSGLRDTLSSFEGS